MCVSLPAHVCWCNAETAILQLFIVFYSLVIFFGFWVATTLNPKSQRSSLGCESTQIHIPGGTERKEFQVWWRICCSSQLQPWRAFSWRQGGCMSEDGECLGLVQTTASNFYSCSNVHHWSPVLSIPVVLLQDVIHIAEPWASPRSYPYCVQNTVWVLTALPIVYHVGQPYGILNSCSRFLFFDKPGPSQLQSARTLLLWFQIGRCCSSSSIESVARHTTQPTIEYPVANVSAGQSGSPKPSRVSIPLPDQLIKSIIL